MKKLPPMSLPTAAASRIPSIMVLSSYCSYSIIYPKHTSHDVGICFGVCIRQYDP